MELVIINPFQHISKDIQLIHLILQFLTNSTLYSAYI